MSDYISGGEFPEQIQKRLDAGNDCGSTIGKGWLPLVIELDAQLSELNPDYTINQIKQKFGGLRYYVTGVGDEGHELIMEAERKAAQTCEICGAPGKVHPGVWMNVRCEEHKRGS